jgi:putative endonuclease
MAVHNQLGKEAEALAARYFSSKGYEILFCNWRHSHYEIDIIASKNDIVHFIEVKARQSSAYGHPEESVSRKKFKSLLAAADEFLFQNKQFRHAQYDILSIIIAKDREPEYFLIEDVYL